MNKRTNILEKFTECVAKLLIPIFLFTICIFDVDLDRNRIIEMSTFLSYPFESFLYLKSIKNQNSDEDRIIASMGEVYDVQGTVSVKSDIPDDVQALISEEKEKDVSNDGKITEDDYSQKNATAEYDKIFLRNTTVDMAINIEDYIDRNIVANVDKDKPSVLIYHTHTSESYELIDRGFYSNMRSVRSENKKETVVRIGDEICKILNDKGYKTIHITDTFDEQYSGAYERSRERISEVLKNNPSIQIVLDIHRDSIYQKDGSRIKTVTEIDNRKVAQIMITTGCETGNVTDFPNWEKNLVFALKLQRQLANDNPKLVRPLVFSSRKYNMDLLPCAISVDIGTDANTLTEAIFSARYLAQSLAKILKECEI